MKLWPVRPCLTQCEFADLLRARRERDLAGGDLLAGADDPHDLPADARSDCDVEALEHTCGKALVLAEQAEEDVLAADVVVPELAGLFLGKNNDMSGALA